ncbi:hypothetical protein [Rhodococcus jostii]|uniref:hypothetical protein n=1 Tax=Rhodococcus jostii TaxID=132919 RepID=UPI00362C442C
MSSDLPAPLELVLEEYARHLGLERDRSQHTVKAYVGREVAAAALLVDVTGGAPRRARHPGAAVVARQPVRGRHRPDDPVRNFTAST